MAKVTRPRTAPTPAKTTKPTAFPAADKGNGHANAELETAIRARAYEIYEQRGRQDGFDQDDWFQAEAEVLSQNHRRTA